MSIKDRLFGKRKHIRPFCSVVVPAAGHATRMAGEEKILSFLDGETVIVHTLRALSCCAMVDEIIVVTRQDLIVPISHLCQDYQFEKVTKVLLGGESRGHSVHIGAQEVSPKAQLIAVHDGARPLVSQRVLQETITAAAQCSAAAPALPVKDTIKQSAGNLVTATLERETLRAVQTPQVFQADLIRAALSQAIGQGIAITDDCSAVERLGMTITLTQGDEENIKITTPMDLVVAQAILAGRGL